MTSPTFTVVVRDQHRRGRVGSLGVPELQSRDFHVVARHEARILMIAEALRRGRLLAWIIGDVHLFSPPAHERPVEPTSVFSHAVDVFDKAQLLFPRQQRCPSARPGALHPFHGSYVPLSSTCTASTPRVQVILSSQYCSSRFAARKRGDGA